MTNDAALAQGSQKVPRSTEIGHLHVGGAQRFGHVGIAAGTHRQPVGGTELLGGHVEMDQGGLGVPPFDGVDQATTDQIFQHRLTQAVTQRIERVGNVDDGTLGFDALAHLDGLQTPRYALGEEQPDDLTGVGLDLLANDDPAAERSLQFHPTPRGVVIGNAQHVDSAGRHRLDQLIGGGGGVTRVHGVGVQIDPHPAGRLGFGQVRMASDSLGGRLHHPTLTRRSPDRVHRPTQPTRRPADTTVMAFAPGQRSTITEERPAGIESLLETEATTEPTRPFGVRGAFLSDSLGWALGAAMIIMIGAVGIAAWRLLIYQDKVAEPLPEFSAQAAAWLADQQEVAVYRDGKVYLYGVVRTEQERQAMISLANRVLGADKVVADEYYVDSTRASRQGTATMRVAEPVLFELNSDVIAPGFESVLGFVATLMQQNPSVNIQVLGHTDDIGEESSNLQLSQARAQAGVHAVVSRGGDPSRITAEGRGEGQPIADNATEAGRAINRRVEFILTGL